MHRLRAATRLSMCRSKTASRQAAVPAVSAAELAAAADDLVRAGSAVQAARSGHVGFPRRDGLCRCSHRAAPAGFAPDWGADRDAPAHFAAGPVPADWVQPAEAVPGLAGDRRDAPARLERVPAPAGWVHPAA